MSSKMAQPQQNLYTAAEDDTTASSDAATAFRIRAFGQVKKELECNLQ
ncbi:unnamed protein product, partial [Amoebophrya sp. A25]|eukprot:GSA25T00008359001.1